MAAMGFSDAATPVLWVGNIKAGLQQKDVMHVFSRQARLAAPCRAGSPLCALWIALPPDYTAPIAAHAAAYAAGRPATCRSPPPLLPAPTRCSLTAVPPLSAALEPSGASSWAPRRPAPAPPALQLRCTLLRLPRQPRRSQR